MVYGIYDNRMDTETTISWMRSKNVAKGAMVSTTDTLGVIPNLAAGDVVYCAGVDRFVSMARMYEVCSIIYQRNASIRFFAQPYLDMRNGKQFVGAMNLRILAQTYFALRWPLLFWVQYCQSVGHFRYGANYGFVLSFLSLLF